jgi:hypothetical protein
MTEKELDLLQFSAIHMAEFCARSPKVMWSEVFQLHSLRAPSDNVPDDILGDSFTPWSPVSAHGSEDSAGRHFRRFSPSIDSLLDPSGHGNGSDMTTFTNQIYDGPMALPDLQILNSKRRELGPA